MPLEIPNLDDRRWADLVADAQALIPREAPRWTDHNVHDPGITFIELFAWLAEMQIYQLNRVGERHREVFGRLANVQRRLRTPARVQIAAEQQPALGMTIPEGTQLVPLEGDELVFETTTELRLTRTTLQQIVVDDGSGPIDQTNANATFGATFLAFGEQARAGAELRLGFDAFYPLQDPNIRVSLDVFTADLDPRCGTAAPVPSDNGGQDAAEPPIDLAWEYLGAGRQWIALNVERDESAALSKSGTVTLTTPDQAVPSAAQGLSAAGAVGGAAGGGRADRQLVWIRARIVRGYYDIEPRLRQVALNMLPCAQRETVRDELLGVGNERPDQSYELAKGPILLRDSDPPVRIEVGDEEWKHVLSFDAATPDSRQFMFDAESRRVLFGNGLNGRVPAPGENVRALWYQTSNGRSGNVAKGLVWKFRTLTVPGVSLRNPSPATGGADPEPLAEMELRARAQLSRPQRAVTLLDIERLALSTPYAHVARAYAIPNCPTIGRITVVVVPKIRPGRTGPPVRPSDAFLAAVRRYLEERRLLCDNLRVMGPIYTEVRVAARLRLAKGAGAAAAIARATDTLDRFLSGEDPASLEQPPSADATSSPCPTRWPFGRSVFPSDVYAVLDGVAGVDAASDVVLSARRNGTPIAADATGAIPVPRIGLVFAGAHDFVVESEPRRRQ